MVTKASANFAPLLVSHAAEVFNVMRMEGDLKICGILQSADEMGTFLTQEKIAVMRASRVELFDA